MPSTRSTACWTWDARTTSASPDPRRGWGQCAPTPDPCTTVARQSKPRCQRQSATQSMVASRWAGSATVKPVAAAGGGQKARLYGRRPSPDTGKPMLLKGECVAALTEVLIVAQSRFQIDALHTTLKRSVTMRLEATRWMGLPCRLTTPVTSATSGVASGSTASHGQLQSTGPFSSIPHC